MKLLIPKEKAIQILKDRISEIYSHEFNADAWKERTVLDLKEIFPVGSTQYIKIQTLLFDTFVVADKQKFILEAQKKAEQILKSYVEYIIEHSKITEERKKLKEKDFEAKYYELLKDRDLVITDYIAFLEKYEELLEENSNLFDKSEDLNNQIKTIRKNTIQIDNVSLSKLSKAFFNLPLWQIITSISIIIGFIIETFRLGNIYQKNEDNNQIFDLKAEINLLKSSQDVSNKLILKKDSKINNANIIMDSLANKLNK